MSIEGIYEESVGEISSNDSNNNDNDVQGDYDEIDYLNLKTREMYELGENLKHMLDK